MERCAPAEDRVLHFETLLADIWLVLFVLAALVLAVVMMARADRARRRRMAQIAPFVERRRRARVILWLVGQRQLKLGYRPADRDRP